MEPKTRDPEHWKRDLGHLWYVRPEIQNKHLLSNMGRKTYDSNKLNQMSYKKDLTNIFDLQSHKKTAAFLVNKFLFITSSLT